MERYLRRNRLSDFLDGLGIRVLLIAAGVGWFTWLWGLGMPALLAGCALGVLLMMTRTRLRRRTVDRREQALRCRIGAEMMMEELLYADATATHQRVADLLTSRWPLHILHASGDGVLALQGKERLLIQAPRMPADGEISRGDLLAAQRIALREKADRIILCVMGKVSPKVEAGAEDMPVPVRILRREVLMALAGRMAPATDEQLVQLGKRRARSVGRGGIARLVFRQDKARRYFGYGLMMVLLYVISNSRLYAVPGMVCLILGVISGCDLHRDGEKL